MAAALFPSFGVGWFAAGPKRRRWRAAWRRSSGCKKRLPLVAPEETKTLREFETTGIAMRRCATEQHALDEEVQRVRALLHFNVNCISKKVMLRIRESQNQRSIFYSANSIH